MGVHASNYSGALGVGLQPASFVDGRYVVDINLFSVSANVWNNAQAFNTKNMPGWWVQSFSKETGWMKPDSTFKENNIEDLYRVGQKKPLGWYQNSQIDLLNVNFHVGKKIAIGFGIRSRVVANAENFSTPLYKLLTSGLDYASLWDKDFSNQNANISMLAWNEYYLNYGQVIYDGKRHFVKAGVNLKLLQGMGAAYMYAKNFSYGLENENTSFHLRGDFNYGYSDNLDSGSDVNFLSSLSGAASKVGFGADLGIVYEFRPKYQDFKYDMDGVKDLWRRDKNKYLARVGVSFLDIGGMTFRKGGESRDFSVNSNVQFDLDVFKEISSLEDLDRVIDSLVTNNVNWTSNQNSGASFRKSLPSAFSFQGDFKIWNDFYVNVTGMFSLIPKGKEGAVRVANTISVTPSYDFKWVGLFFPMSYNEYQGFRAGVGLRAGPLTVGFTDWVSMLASGKVRGTGVYMGARIPILYKKPKDRDGDKVSDKKDLCPTVPGLWEFKGCPDTDGDGIQDSADECPGVWGLKEFNGCPDTDGDGIPDKDDACPFEKGLKEFDGCPDTDGDGIPDKDDECPNEAGLSRYNGCPDTDGDGIPDKDDACPNATGPIENDGCPDSDGDGVLDYLDECPDRVGPIENNGCPWPDSDGDGVLDKDDKCPTIAGPVANFGCPYEDTDGDGVIDSEDDCPNTPGTVANKGCPEVELEVKEILQTAFDALEFETGRDVIKASSKPSLDVLAGVLIKRPDWKLLISGHTDNVGNAQTNLILSKKRAEAVRAYLMSQGVDEKRFIVSYFGDTKPIADNSTVEGRQKNRRVDMNVMFE